MSGPDSGFLYNLRRFLDRQAASLPILTGRFLRDLPVPTADLSGKNIIITGGNSGLGLELARQLAAMHANIFIACRNPKKAEDARQYLIKQNPEAKVVALPLDTSSFESVRRFAAEWRYGAIDALLHNAGIASYPAEEEITTDGFERIYQVNFLSSFILTHLLEPKLSSRARVVLTSSMIVHTSSISDTFSLSQVVGRSEPGFHAPTAKPRASERYAASKLHQVAFAKLLQQHFDRDRNNSRLAFSWEPGLVKTAMANGISGYGMFEDTVYFWVHTLLNYTGNTVAQGAATGTFTTASEEKDLVEKGKGQYISRCVVRITPVDDYSQEKLDRLWIRWSADAGISWT